MESILNNKENNIDPKTGKFFPFKKEGDIICRAYLEIRAEYGTALKEQAYHKLLKEWFSQNNIDYLYEPSLEIRSKFSKSSVIEL